MVDFTQDLDFGPEVPERDVGRGLEDFRRDGGAVPQGAVDDAELALSELCPELEGRGLDLPVGVEGEARGREVGDACERGGVEGDELGVCVVERGGGGKR